MSETEERAASPEPSDPRSRPFFGRSGLRGLAGVLLPSVVLAGVGVFVGCGDIAGTSEADSGPPPARSPSDPAVELLVEADALLETRKGPAMLEAERLYRRATDLAPESAEAYAKLASTSALLALYDLRPPRASLAAAAHAAETALRLDPDLSAPYASLGLAAFLGDWDFERAEEHFRKALDLDPGDASVCHWYAMLLSSLRRFDEAVALMDEAVSLDSEARILQIKRGTVLLYAGRLDEAEARLLESAERWPEMTQPWRDLGFVSIQRGEFVEALRRFERAVQLSGGSGSSTAALGYALALAGRREESEALWEERRDSTDGRGERHSAMHRALHAAGLGRPYADDQTARRRALLWRRQAVVDLEQALGESDPGLVYLAVRPGYESLYGEAGFQAIVEQVALLPPPEDRS